MSNILPAGVAQLISEYAEDVEEEQVEEDEWETLYGCRTIYRVKHFITYGGGPEGGYVFLEEGFPNMDPGWYRWRRATGRPTYEPLEPNETVIYRSNSDGEAVRVVDYGSYELKDDEMYVTELLEMDD